MITPSVFAQAGVIFTLFHVYCYLGMALYGGVVTPGADFGVSIFLRPVAPCCKGFTVLCVVAAVAFIYRPCLLFTVGHGCWPLSVMVVGVGVGIGGGGGGGNC